MVAVLVNPLRSQMHRCYHYDFGDQNQCLLLRGCAAFDAYDDGEDRRLGYSSLRMGIGEYWRMV